MTAPSQTLRVRITGTVGDLIRSCAEARAAIKSVTGETDRGRGPVRALTDGLARLGSVMRGVRVIATPALVAGAIPGVLALGAALVQAAGAGLLLPGAIAGAITVFGALKIATSGFGEALKNLGDPKKFAEAIATLTPSARAAALAIQGLKAPFDDLRNSLQERLFAGLDTEITATGKVLLNVLRPAFEAIASTANHTLSGILIDLRSVRSQADFRAITGDSARAFSNLAAAVRPLLHIFTDVAAVGASFLPGLTAGAGSAAQKFSLMVSHMRETGELAAIIQRGLDVLKQLGEIAANVGGILSGVFRAADTSGGGLLNTLVAVTGTLKEVINSTSGQTALGAFFGTLATISATLGNALRVLAPALAVVLTNLQTSITAVAPSIGPLAAAIGAVLVSLAPLLPLLAQVAIVVAGQLVVGLGILKPLLDGLVAVLQFLSPVLVPIVGSLVAVKVAMLVLGPIFSLVSGGVGSITTAWKVLSLVFAASPIGFIITLLALLVGGLIYAYQTSETFRNIVDGVFRWISNAISSAVSFIGNMMSFLGNLFLGAGRAAWDAITSNFNSIVSFVFGFPLRILSALGNLGRLLWDAGASIVSGLWDGIVARWNQMLSWVRDGLASLRDLFPFSPAREGPFSGRGHTTYSGVALITDMARGIRAAQPVLSAAAAAAMGAAQQRLSSPATLTAPTTVRASSDAGGGSLDPAELAAAIGAELRAIFERGIRTDVDYQGLTLRVNAVNRANARR